MSRTLASIHAAKEAATAQSFGNLTVIATPPDGNCQFSAVARGLRNCGHNAFASVLPTTITMQTLRAFVAERITPSDVSDLLNTYGSMGTCAWLNQIQHETWTAEDIVAHIKSVVASSKPVTYQGDDWSLGIMARELNVYFVVLRNDGTVQRGLPALKPGVRIIILYFYDMDPNERPSGTTMGHYDLIASKDDRYPDGKTVFTLGTLPAFILTKLKEHAATRVELEAAERAPPPPAPSAPTRARDDEPPSILFPIQCATDPSTSDEWMKLISATLVTLPDRMRYYARLEKRPPKTFEHVYTLALVRSDATLRVVASRSETGFVSYAATLQFEDPMDGLRDPHTTRLDAAAEIGAWVTSHIGKNDAIVKARVHTSASNAEVALRHIDAALVVPNV